MTGEHVRVRVGVYQMQLTARAMASAALLVHIMCTLEALFEVIIVNVEVDGV
jgi:hypothetical protein